MREIYAKFFRFAGRQKGKWYLAVVLEFLQSMAVAAEFIPLFIVLRDMVGGTLSSSTALAAFAIMAASIAVQAVLHYFSHKLEMQASYLMLDDKRLSIGDRVKYMPMGFFNAHSLGNLTAVCTSVMDDLESMSTAIIVRILTGMIHAVVCSLARRARVPRRHRLHAPGELADDHRVAALFPRSSCGADEARRRCPRVHPGHGGCQVLQSRRLAGDVS